MLLGELFTIKVSGLTREPGDVGRSGGSVEPRRSFFRPSDSRYLRFEDRPAQKKSSILKLNKGPEVLRVTAHDSSVRKAKTEDELLSRSSMILWEKSF